MENSSPQQLIDLSYHTESCKNTRVSYSIKSEGEILFNFMLTKSFCLSFIIQLYSRACVVVTFTIMVMVASSLRLCCLLLELYNS